MAQKDTEARDRLNEILIIDRFHDIGIDAECVTFRQIGLFSRRGEHHDGDRLQMRIALNYSQHFQTIDFGHFEIQQNDH